MKKEADKIKNVNIKSKKSENIQKDSDKEEN